MQIGPLTLQDRETWVGLRHALWPHHSLDEHRAEANKLPARSREHGGSPYEVFVCATNLGETIGFIEISLRDRIDFCEARPVGYVEGIYVKPENRRSGAARAMMQVAEQWALSEGCAELASDREADNAVSLVFHLAVGFTVIPNAGGESVYFRKPLA